jgi:hypothetical protein
VAAREGQLDAALPVAFAWRGAGDLPAALAGGLLVAVP